MIHRDPVGLLQTLIQFDTTNPPGNEAAIIRYLNGIIRSHGVETTILAKDDNRPNLIARLSGRGDAPPLLFHGHVDVVPVAGQQWTHSPFGGEIHDGYVWGRGALDMKMGVSMMVCAFLQLVADGITPPGDIILAIMADEEVGSTFGSRFLVEQHAEQFADVQDCIGEFGGFSSYMGGRKFYPIQVTERVAIKVMMTIRGPAGHGAMPVKNGAMAKLGRILTRLENNRFPIHITPPMREMITDIAAHVEPPTSTLLRGLLHSKIGAILLDHVPQLAAIAPMLRSTASPTMVAGSPKLNVIPSAVTLQIDGRTLPGITPPQFVDQLRNIVGKDVEIAVEHRGIGGTPDPQFTLLPQLKSITHGLDSTGIPIPYMQPGVTDGRFFAQHGIQPYGFLPLDLPPDFNFTATVHAADEPVPVHALDFGQRGLYRLMATYKKP